MSNIEYSEDIQGPLRLYLFDHKGSPGVGRLFCHKVKYNNSSEITTLTAKQDVINHIAKGGTVSITNGEGNVVFYAENYCIKYPQNYKDFWERVGWL